MTTVVLDVRLAADSLSEAASNWHPAQPRVHRGSVPPTIEQLWEVLTANRWVLLQAIGGTWPISIGEAATRTGRDEAAMSGDVDALRHAAIIDTAGEDCIGLPHDTVKVELLLRAA